MLRDFFDQINHFVLTHPDVYFTLHKLFWVRWWVFLFLILYFLYKIYVVWPKELKAQTQPRRADHKFEA